MLPVHDSGAIKVHPRDGRVFSPSVSLTVGEAAQPTDAAPAAKKHAGGICLLRAIGQLAAEFLIWVSIRAIAFAPSPR